MSESNSPIIHSPGTLTNKKRKAENRVVAAKKRSPFPRAAKHGKHVSMQGFGNTFGFGK